LGGCYPDKTALGTDADYEFKKSDLKRKRGDAFPYTLGFPGSTTATGDEVSQ
jgi:hypothetical protein